MVYGGLSKTRACETESHRRVHGPRASSRASEIDGVEGQAFDSELTTLDRRLAEPAKIIHLQSPLARQ